MKFKQKALIFLSLVVPFIFVPLHTNAATFNDDISETDSYNRVDEIETLDFSDEGLLPDNALDNTDDLYGYNVSKSSSVPEPSAWLLLGFAIVGYSLIGKSKT